VTVSQEVTLHLDGAQLTPKPHQLGALVGGQRSVWSLLSSTCTCSTYVGRQIEIPRHAAHAPPRGADDAHRLGLELGRELAPLRFCFLVGRRGTSFITTESED
jgi:hypothetical protein